MSEHPLNHVGFGISAGLCAGALVGMVESLYVFLMITPAEYQAIYYSGLLYGAAGALVGAAVGVLLMLAALVRPMSRAVSWSIAFSLVFVVSTILVVGQIIGQQWALDGLLGAEGLVGLVVVLIGVWLGRNILTKTPLRVLPKRKGTFAAFSATIFLGWMVSRAPAPGAAASLKPPVDQGPEYAQLPDVLMIVVDGLRTDALGTYGGPITPAMDNLARQSIIFDQFIVASPRPRASIASLLTSRYPSAHRCQTTDTLLDERLITLPELLQARGYITGGLPNHPEVTSISGFSQGFHWYPFLARFPWRARESTWRLSLYQALLDARDRQPRRLDAYHVRSEIQFDRALRFMDANEGKRWFLMLHLMDLHDLWTMVEEKDVGEPDPDTVRELYQHQVQALDAQLGAFLATLAQKGVHPLIVLTSDQGATFSHRAESALHLRDERIRVPLFLRLPEGERAGTRVPWQVRQVDIAPTIAELLGFGPDEGWQGRDLLEDGFDDHLSWAIDKGQSDDWSIHPASREALTEVEEAGYGLRSLRRNGTKLVEVYHRPDDGPREQPRITFYDLQNDPTEQREIGASRKPQVAENEVRLDVLLQQVQSGTVVRIETSGPGIP